jgi:putative hydrolase of the HAD superfamily
MAIRAVVFDLFDTLVDLVWENLPVVEHRGARLPASVQAMHELLAERADVDFDAFTQALVEGGRGFAESHFAHDREVTTLERFEDLVQRLGLDAPELPALLTEVHMGVLRSGVEVPGHHAELLEGLGRDLRLGVCSNFSHSETALGVLEEAGMRPHFDAIVVSDAFGLRKPRREIFEEVLLRLEAGPDEVVHVGDSLRADVAGAAPLGIRTAWITRRIRDPESRPCWIASGKTGTLVKKLRNPGGVWLELGDPGFLTS